VAESVVREKREREVGEPTTQSYKREQRERKARTASERGERERKARGMKRQRVQKARGTREVRERHPGILYIAWKTRSKPEASRRRARGKIG
jgi:hypothetical protein